MQWNAVLTMDVYMYNYIALHNMADTMNLFTQSIMQAKGRVQNICEEYPTKPLSIEP